MSTARKRQLLAGNRTAALMRRIGEDVRAARGTLGLSRAAIARNAGIARSTVERVEEGTGQVEVSTLGAIMAAVGLDLSVRGYPSERFRTRDSRHAVEIELIRAAASPRWLGRVEVLVGDHGQSADLVLYGADEVIHIEVERKWTDLQAQV